MESIMRLPEVLEMTGLSRSFIYKAIQDGSFPDRVSLGVRAVGWKASEIVDWVNNRAAK
ncbi:AlpA family transcriptional regulator [Duganella sp. BJB476]|uniref:helix-turn-helix transcriptional regulator n=1 Tax=Duganella sp. BJB476 TaxID=1871176 RepID=UPI000E34AA29|nr:AlpA family phage regulatory protein [Duganella sp. BJB476]RFP23895.1 AlpA family phage regulatory protein [Duganella sp. BJB476]